MILTDKQFYKTAINLSIPAFAEANKRFFEGDGAGAAASFAAYVRENLFYDKYFSLHQTEFDEEKKQKILSTANDILNGDLDVIGYAHHYENLEVDWETNQTPTQYCEWIWCLSRHDAFLTLAKAYLITKDTRYATAFNKLIESWIDQVELPIADADNYKGSYAHTGWRTIETGIRMTEPWQYPIHVFMRDGLIPDSLVVKIFKSIWEHSFYIRHYASSHNWLIIELTGLMNLVCLYPFFDNIGAWRHYVWSRFQSELDVQINADGLQYELTTSYHMGIIQNYREVMRLALTFGIEIPERMLEKVHSMHTAVAYLSDPAQCTPAVNDACREFIGPDMEKSLPFFPNDPLFKFFISGGKEGTPPPFLSYAAPYTGHVAMRTGWSKDDTWVFFDSAHHGWGHQHEDKLSVQLYAFGKMLLSDGENYDYDASKMRSMIISSFSHNTALVDTFGQLRSKTHSREEEERIVRERIPSDLAWSFLEDLEVAEGTYNNGYGEDLIKVDHHRKLIFFKKGLGCASPFVLLLDSFYPKDEKEHLYEVHFQLGREEIEKTENSVTVIHENGITLTLLSDCPVEVHTAEYEPRYMGWRKRYAPGVDHEHYPAPAPCFVKRGGVSHAATVIYPAKNEPCKILAVSCDEKSFSLTMADGKVYTFDRADEAFKTYSTTERKALGMPL